MKKTVFYLIFLLNISYLAGCTQPAKHADPFYNVNDDFSFDRIPLINPIEANRLNSSSPWRVLLFHGPWVSKPNSQEVYFYAIEELEKFAVENDVIMAYSSYVNKNADAYVQENYYHWFVIIPEKEVSEGFHTEGEFLQHIQILGIQDPDWQTPDEAYKQFRRTGCLEWIPDCK
jgi:hypothetical protein